MKKIKLGNSDLYVSMLGLGCMGMSEFYGEPDESKAFETLKCAYENGINFFDTADLYGSGANEELLKKFFNGNYNDIVIATKFGFVIYPWSKKSVDGSPRYVKKACEMSLKRLDTECIDLYYQHRVDPEVPIEETVGAMSDLVKEGKVKYIGLCEVSAGTIRRANKVHPISAVQSEYSVWSRDVEIDVFPYCKKTSTEFIAYSPLGRGMLSGKITVSTELDKDDFRLLLPRFKGKNFKNNLETVDTFNSIAESINCTPAQLALAWIYAKNKNVIPIPGTVNKKHVLENIYSLSITLSQDVLQRIDKLQESFKGDRYHKKGMKLINSYT